MLRISLSASQSFESPLLKILFQPVPHFSWIVWGIIMISSFLSSLYILNISPLSDVELKKSFRSVMLLICQTDSVLCLNEAFQFHEVSLVNF